MPPGSSVRTGRPRTVVDRGADTVRPALARPCMAPTQHFQNGMKIASMPPWFAGKVAGQSCGLSHSPGDFMERRAFLNIGGAALGAMLLPPFGRAIAADELL